MALRAWVASISHMSRETKPRRRSPAQQAGRKPSTTARAGYHGQRQSPRPAPVTTASASHHRQRRSNSGPARLEGTGRCSYGTINAPALAMSARSECGEFSLVTCRLSPTWNLGAVLVMLPSRSPVCQALRTVTRLVTQPLRNEMEAFHPCPTLWGVCYVRDAVLCLLCCRAYRRCGQWTSTAPTLVGSMRGATDARKQQGDFFGSQMLHRVCQKGGTYKVQSSFTRDFEPQTV